VNAVAIAPHETMTGNSAAPAQLTGEVLPKVQEHARLLDSIKVGTASGK
jgi:hypothetical protein